MTENIPSKEEQKEVVTNHIDYEFEEGDECYLLTSTWWNAFVNHIEFEQGSVYSFSFSSSTLPTSFPCKVYNSPLVVNEIEDTTSNNAFMRMHGSSRTDTILNKEDKFTPSMGERVSSYDYKVVNATLWGYINKWYGCDYEIKRKMLAQGLSYVPELKQLTIKIAAHYYQEFKDDDMDVKQNDSMQDDKENAPTETNDSEPDNTKQLDNQDDEKENSKSNITVKEAKRDGLFYCSKLMTIGELKQSLAKCLQTNAKYLHISGSTYAPPYDDEDLIKNCMIFEGKKIIVSDDRISSKSNSSSGFNVSAGSGFSTSSSSIFNRNTNDLYSTYNTSSSSFTKPSITNNEGIQRKGLCGLSNLGNTCFMNSAVQCLSNTKELTEFFLEEKHKKDINRDNPIGLKGQLAEAYHQLLRLLHLSSSTSFAPRTFKERISEFAPQFTGIQQHDSHELLFFVLDGLHEDLNRVKDKKYIENKESNGRADTIVADEAWNMHLQRNDSIIVDMFGGQYRSKLFCPDCKKISTIFDPNLGISLPLPQQTKKQIQILLIRASPKCPIEKYGVIIKSTDKIKAVLENLSKLTETSDLPTVSASSMKFNKVEQSVITKSFSLADSVSLLGMNEEYVVYEIKNTVKAAIDAVIIPVYHQVLKKANSFFSIASKPELINFYLPFYICVSRTSTTYEQLNDLLTERVRVLLKHKDFNIAESHLTFKILNASGKAIGEIEESDDGQHLSFSSVSAICIEWNAAFRSKLYDSSAATRVDSHSSIFRSVTNESNAPCSLFDCLELFTQPELLGKDEKWRCPYCKELKRATKTMDLWKVGDILVIQLKRFKEEARIWKAKRTNLVDFPITGLDLTDFVKHNPSYNQSNCIYDLYGVINHMGGIMGGHYTAYAKNPHKADWFEFDDSRVNRVSQSHLVSKSAYVLFYRRRKEPSS